MYACNADATGMYGKYLNSGGMGKICAAPVGDGSLHVPAGWLDFLGACPDTCYVNCNYNRNGESAWFTNASSIAGSNYGTSVIGNVSLAFAKRAMAANWPFFVYIASHAPHGPATPAPWYEDLYSTPDVIAPRTPAFNVSSPDKHWVVATQPLLTEDYTEQKLDKFYKNRMRSLRSVDDIVAAFHAAVKAAGQLERTYFFFTSDHGLHMGQFCLGACKRQPYDTDLRIPALAVGPGITAGPLPIVASIPDLAPTFLDLCGAREAIAELKMDGRSLLPLLRSNARSSVPSDGKVLAAAAAAGSGGVAWRQAHLVEYLATTGVVNQPPGNNHLKDNSNNTFIGTVQNALLLFPRRP
jgi:N-acetylglucosamine-6-sulfatase|eukprot:COSAG06_NODE_839_length_12005_cov_54.158492_9_plen_354_part_00